jgi:hypothetical protein
MRRGKKDLAPTVLRILQNLTRFGLSQLTYILWQTGKLWRALGPVHLLVIGVLLAALKDRKKPRTAAFKSE